MPYELTVDWTGPVPTMSQWQAAIDDAGFETVLEAEVEPSAAPGGWWPATYRGAEGGFEFYLSRNEESGWHALFSFGWRNPNERPSASFAAAALARLTSGSYVDPQTSARYSPADVIEGVRAEIAREEGGV